MDKLDYNPPEQTKEKISSKEKNVFIVPPACANGTCEHAKKKVEIKKNLV